MAILHAVGNVHAKTLTSYIDEVRINLEEAKDNVKFLGTIRNSTNLLVISFFSKSCFLWFAFLQYIRMCKLHRDFIRPKVDVIVVSFVFLLITV